MNENWTPKNPPPELSDEDAELLSAYIDNMLDATEVAALEARLANDAFLRSELAAMQQMLGWLKTMPQMKAPRNFTIREADVKPVAPKLVVMPRRNNWQLLSAAAAIVVVVIGFAAFIANNPALKNEEAQIALAPSQEVLDEAEANEPAASPMLMATMGVPPVANGGSTSGGNTGSGGGAPIEPQEPTVLGETTDLENAAAADTGTDGSTNPADRSMESALLEATSTVVAGGQMADVVIMSTQTQDSAAIRVFATTTPQPTIVVVEEQESMTMQQTTVETTEDISVLSAPVEEAESDDADAAGLAVVTSLAYSPRYIDELARAYLQKVLETLRR
jgi:anti-sigma factor RsiW